MRGLGVPRGASAGLTLVELLVGMALLTAVLTIIFSTTLSTVDLFRSDQARLGANRDARSALDVLQSDVRQAGERLTGDIPAILVTRDINGNSILSLRRSLTDAPLPVCAPLPNAVGAYVNANNPAAALLPGNISNQPAACSATEQDLSAWTALIADGITDGFVYDAGDGRGQFMTMTGTSSTGTLLKTQAVRLSGPTATFNPLKTVSNLAGRDVRLYALEERQYALVGGALVLAGGTRVAQIATPRVLSFQVVPYLKGSPPVAAPLPFPGVSSSGKLNSWKRLAYLDVTLTVAQSSGSTTVQRTLTQRLVPRNTGSSE